MYRSAFNEVAAHDVEWGAFSVCYIDREAWEEIQPNKFKRHLVSIRLLLLELPSFSGIMSTLHDRPADTGRR